MPVGSCAGVPEADRSDKTAFIRYMNVTTAQAQEFCRQQMRAIMTADDEFAATLQLLQDRGALDNTLVIFTSDNGYMWGEHGRTEKFIPYEPSIRVPLYLRWPGHIAAGSDGARIVSGLDLLPTMLEAAQFTLPPTAPPLDGESLLHPAARTTMYSEYYTDSANPGIPYWRMIRGVASSTSNTETQPAPSSAASTTTSTTTPQRTQTCWAIPTPQTTPGQHHQRSTVPTYRILHLRRNGLRPVGNGARPSAKEHLRASREGHHARPSGPAPHHQHRLTT